MEDSVVTTNPAENALAAELGASTAPYCGAVTPAIFTSLEHEFSAAISGCIVADHGWSSRMSVTGSDAQRWLNGMLTNTAALEDRQGNYNFVLNAQGRLQGDAYLFRLGSGYVLQTSRNQQARLMEWFDHYIIMDDVTLTAAAEKPATLCVAGPESLRLLQQLGIATELPAPLQLMDATLDGCPVTVVRDDTSCVPCFYLWHEATDSRKLWELLRQAGAVPAGSATLDLLRIASGTPLFGVDMVERDLAQETGQTRALHFHKGCYLGQEIVERVRSRGNVHRGWRGFQIHGAEAEFLRTGAEIVAEEKPVGTLTSVATLPLATGIARVGLGIVRLQPLEEHKPLQASGNSLTVAALPFLKKFN